MPSAHTKALSIALVLVLLLGVAWLFSTLRKNDQQRDPVIVGCEERDSASLGDAAAFFATSLEEGTVLAMGGARPIEGFEPYMFMDAYPGLQASDFDCVHALEGAYRAEGPNVVLTLTSGPQMQTTAGAMITPEGMAILLENIGDRLRLPITTEDEVREILRIVSFPDASVSITPERISLSGTYRCLPHKEGIPPTKECALGLEAEGGLYYVLDFMLMSQTMPDISVGDRISVTGVFTPIETLSTDQWDKYPIEGILSVTDSLEKL